MTCLSTSLSVIQARSIEWALVKVGAASMRARPAHSAELETQASYGAPVQLLDSVGEWRKVRMADGYEAYAHLSALHPVDSAHMASWRRAPRLIVTSPLQHYILSDTTGVRHAGIVADISLGAIVEGNVCPGSRYADVRLPDGRRGYVPSQIVEDFDRWCDKTPSVERILDAARAMNGVSYLWGGTTPKAVDCSGFTQLCYVAAGLLLPRNASEQALSGDSLDVSRPETFRPGDLLFFGDGDGDGVRITHVAVYCGATRFLHASGRVHESSFNPADSLFIPRRVLKAVRILGTPGVNAFRYHPWYKTGGVD